MTEDEVKLQHELTEIRRSAGARYPGYADVYLVRVDQYTGGVGDEVLDVITTTIRLDPHYVNYSSNSSNFHGAGQETPPVYGPAAYFVLGRLIADAFTECRERLRDAERRISGYEAHEVELPKENAELKGQIELMRSSVEQAKEKVAEAEARLQTHVAARTLAEKQRDATSAKLTQLENALGKQQVEALMRKGDVILAAAEAVGATRD